MELENCAKCGGEPQWHFYFSKLAIWCPICRGNRVYGETDHACKVWNNKQRWINKQHTHAIAYAWPAGHKQFTQTKERLKMESERDKLVNDIVRHLRSTEHFSAANEVACKFKRRKLRAYYDAKSATETRYNPYTEQWEWRYVNSHRHERFIKDCRPTLGEDNWVVCQKVLVGAIPLENQPYELG